MQKISLKEQWKIWSHVALHSFGGPAGQIAVIHKVVVEDKKLITEERFLHALNFCMLLPGPEAQQLATYMGWLMNKWRGGLLAGGLFILPGFLSILLLSYLYVTSIDLIWVQGCFYGIKPAITAIVFAALFRIANKSLKSKFHWSLAVMAFVALFLLNIPFPLVVVIAAIAGMLHGKIYAHHNLIEMDSNLTFPSWRQTLGAISVWGLVWISPIIVTLLIFGPESTFHQMNLFFSKMAMVTFGGAYAALSYVAQSAVNVYGWLQGSEMLDGLAMAETTPGPLIQTVQFVGFMGAYRFPDLPSPGLSALVGSILSTWMTFSPCFLWIFTFAPYVEFIRGQKIFSDALQAITASVVGVILNLSLWFVLKTIFMQSIRVQYFVFDFEFPIMSTIDLMALGICLVAFWLQFKLNWSLFKILGVCTILGISAKLFA